jgi:hypothetical protein
MKEIVPMRTPLWELVLQRELSMLVDQWVEQITEKVDCGPSFGVFRWNHQLEFEDSIAVISFVYKQCSEPHYEREREREKSMTR